jgi:hypothetical protein
MRLDICRYFSLFIHDFFLAIPEVLIYNSMISNVQAFSPIVSQYPIPLFFWTSSRARNLDGTYILAHLNIMISETSKETKDY